MRKYGVWAGNPRGRPENTTRCIANVSDGTGWHWYQCSRKRGHGPDGLYCKQHARMIAEGRHVSVPKEEEPCKPKSE